MIEILEKTLGEYFPLARQIIRSTLMYLIFIACVFVVRQAAAVLFPHDDFTSNLLHVVDAYSTFVGVLGFVVWITLDMYFLIQQVRFGKQKEPTEVKNDSD